MATLSQQLEQGLIELGLTLPATSQQCLLSFVELLDKWNRAYNLTAIRDPAEMVTRHLLDSLAVLPYVAGPHVLDVGTGAGLPGIPLAVAHPEWSLTLLDANAKKTRFITQAVGELSLGNVHVVTGRVEAYRPDVPPTTVVTRAFASIPDMLAAAGHLLGPGCRLLAMKGAYPQAELDAMPAGFQVSAVHAVHVPGLEAQRHVVVINPR